MKNLLFVISAAVALTIFAAGVVAQDVTDSIQMKIYPDIEFNIEPETGAYTDEAGLSIDAKVERLGWHVLSYEASLTAEPECCSEDQNLDALNNNDVGSAIPSNGSYARIPVGSDVLTLRFPGPITEIDGLAIYAGYEDRLPRKFTVKDDQGLIVGKYSVPDLSLAPASNSTRVSLLVHFEQRIYTTELTLDVERDGTQTEPVSLREIRVYNDPARKNTAIIATADHANPSINHFLAYDEIELGKPSIRASLNLPADSKLPNLSQALYAADAMSRAQWSRWYVDFDGGTLLGGGVEFSACLTDGAISPYIEDIKHPYEVLYLSRCTNLESTPYIWTPVKAAQRFQFPMRADGNGVMRPMIKNGLGQCLWAITSTTGADDFNPLTYLTRDIPCDAAIEDNPGARPLFLIFPENFNAGR